MPRRTKAPRLWLRRAQYKPDGRLHQAATWIIRDGRRRASTGCGADDVAGAERALETYLARKRLAVTTQGVRDPAAIRVADVLALYLRDKAPRHARPAETTRRIDRLLDF